MKTLEDLVKLCDMLDAEIDGRRIDRHEARQLARHLADHCPSIASTLSRIAERMGGTTASFESGAASDA